MKFSTREDIQAPIEHVFRMVSDFDGFERSALRRGVEVHRKQTLTQLNAELGWDIGFDYRNKPRRVSAELVQYDPPNGLLFFTYGPGITADGVIDLVALSRARTRLSVSLDLKPTSLGGRLTVQSLKLAKSRLLHRFRTRIATYSDTIENSYKR